MMQKYLSVSSLKVSLATLLCLGGSVLLSLIAVLRILPFLEIYQSVTLLLLINLITGGIWGLLINRVLNANSSDLFWRTGIRWTLSFMLGTIVLAGGNQLLHYIYDWRRPYDPAEVNLLFSLFFITVTVVVGMLNVRGLLNTLGYSARSTAISQKTGMVIFYTYTLSLLVLYLLGWKVGDEPGVLYKMSKVVTVSAALSALAGGYAVSWQLENNENLDASE